VRRWDNGKNARYIWNECRETDGVEAGTYGGALNIARRALNDMG